MPDFSLFPDATNADAMPPVVARGVDGPVNQAEFLARAVKLARWLQESAPPGDVSVLTTRRLDTLLACVAVWLGGRTALLAPTNRAASLFADEQGPVFASDASGIPVGRVGACVAAVVGSAGVQALPPRIARDRELVSVVTSGTSGGLERHVKTAGQLLGEVDTLARVLGWSERDVVLATVPGHHLYGLLFSLLLPLRSGAAVVVHPSAEPDVFHPAELSRLAREVGATRLVTVPAHLRTLLDADLDLGGVRQVVCSAAALDPSVARAFEARFGAEVVDVLGSTETGGLGLRRPSASLAYTPLPGVSLRTDDNHQLWVRSSFADRDGRELATGDRGTLDETGRFVHAGRTDGVVKVGGKRISLQEVEALVRTAPGVRDAVARAQATPGLRGEQIHLLVEADGLSVEQLKEYLRPRIDPVFLPRRLRILPALSRSDRGKVPREAFDAAFQRDTIEMDVVASADSPRFCGHFPNEAVFPGVAQLADWVLPAVRNQWGPGELERISRLKFAQRIVPGDQLRLRLERTAPDKIQFELWRAGERCSSGMVSLRPSRR